MGEIEREEGERDRLKEGERGEREGLWERGRERER